MPHNLTETSTFDAPITVPDDGDDDVAASVNDPFQKLANRTKYLNTLVVAMNGLLVGGQTLYCTNAATLKLSAIGKLVLGGVSFSTSVESSITVSVMEGGGSFANNAWHYLYAYNNGGSLAFQISTTAPDSGLTWKTGGTTFRYLGCFRTNGTNIVSFRKTGQFYRWSVSQYFANYFNLLNIGGTPNPVSSVVLTALTLISPASGGTSLVPPHVHVAELFAAGSNSGGASTQAPNSIEFASDAADTGDTIPLRISADFSTGAGLYAQGSMTFSIELNASQQVAYNSNGLSLDIIIVMGFWEA